MAGGGGGGYRPLTPEEADMYGIPNEGQRLHHGAEQAHRASPDRGSLPDSASAAAGYASRMASARNTLTGRRSCD